MAPGMSRTASPEAVSFAVSGVMTRRGQSEYALFNRGLFSTYLRPSALLGIRTFDVPDVPHVVSHLPLAPALIVSPEEREARTKQGCFDLTVVLDDVRDPQLGRDLLEQKRERLLRAGVKEEDDTGEISLWSFRAAQFSAAWSSAIEHLALGSLCTTPYQNRHGGPSRDIQLKLRTMEEVQKRGHWKAASSLRNYEKAGRLHKVVAAIPEGVMTFGEKFRLHFAAVARPSSWPVG